MGTNDLHEPTHDLHVRLHALHFATEGLDGLLDRVAVLAADMVDVDASAGITVIRGGRPTSVAWSDERSEALDEIQYANGDGPCLHAARTGTVVSIPDLATEARWPHYLRPAADSGLRCSLSMPLALGAASGALNLYAFEPHTFTDAERAVISQFCDEASRAVSLALRHDKVSEENDHLHAAMGTRRVIDQAIGLIMAQNRCSPDEAFAILRRASQNRNVKINRLAADLIRDVTGSEADADLHWQH